MPSWVGINMSNITVITQLYLCLISLLHIVPEGLLFVYMANCTPAKGFFLRYNSFRLHLCNPFQILDECT